MDVTCGIVTGLCDTAAKEITRVNEEFCLSLVREVLWNEAKKL